MKKNQENEKDLEELEEILEPQEEEVKEAPEVQESEDELAKLQDRYLRLQAEYSNYRRRTTEEKASIYKHANERLILDILPVLDNFERALTSMESDDAAKPYVEGVELIQKSLIQVLEKEGLCAIEALGQEFDPCQHHAVLTEECSENEAGVVLDELQKGYSLKEKVIRPTMVKVSK